MLTINDLNTNVLNRIFDFAVYPAPDGLVKWRRLLPLLAICQNWRAAGVNAIYKYAYVDDNDVDIVRYSDKANEDVGPSRLVIKDRTNISLIRQNGFCSKVEVLSFKSEDCWTGDLLSVATAMDLIKYAPYDYSVLKRFLKSSASIPQVHLTDDPRNIEFREVIARLATSVANKLFPNVTCLRSSLLDAYVSMSYFVARLIGCYGEQLTELDFSGPGMFGECPVLTGLTKLRLKLDFSPEPPLLLVHTKGLQNVEITVEDTQFRWDLFQSDGRSDTITFNSLKSLSLREGDYNLEDADSRGPESTNTLRQKLEFPVLTKLALSEIQLRDEDIHSLMRAPLTEFSCKDELEFVLAICKRGISGLSSVHLEIYLKAAYLLGVDVASELNEIFAKIHDVGSLSCVFPSSIASDDMTRIYWPNITHLTLRTDFIFEGAIMAVSQMPNLEKLTFMLQNFLEDEIEEARSFLENLEEICATPTSSVLRKLILHPDGPQPDEEFYKALGALKWYFPKLESIKVRDTTHKALLHRDGIESPSSDVSMELFSEYEYEDGDSDLDPDYDYRAYFD
ncbi:hypothetical protein H4R20_003497 [Coemansia guatemalensis]|uniref:Uncharacterized protein n=1 Tax=Coemansia guatemalensis TaxID=2761395 RepID=A0A9W8HTI6_9FUNG|nr:hypothetical protein H4R20_003497 [Coemansia guatemalensis]